VPWEDEAKALERHIEVISALQREFIGALLRVAEEYDYDPIELAQGAGNTMHTLFQPLFRIQQQRMMEQQQAMQARQQDRPEPSP
jgi:hypothetical protein